ncbi:MAG: biotin/lipoyl-binding protein [Lachnospiraceae bacterium]|nr:biotin/lipoyl-binding protein [Lachnospiraceae bacterium]
MEKDEEKLISRRRLEKWMKIFLVFLAFVWLCTIISKSIYVSGLTQVNTDTVSKKYVEHIVETEGIVTTGGEIAVNTQSGLRVDRIYVRQGDEVKEGDVLFTIDLSDISDIISAKETELSKQQCNLSDIQVNAVIDAQQKEVALLWAQEDYETADKETAVAKERAKVELEKAEAELGKHLADIAPYTSDSARRNAWDDYHDWVNSGYNISDKITAKEREIQDLEDQLAELERQIISNGNVLMGAKTSFDTKTNIEGNPNSDEDLDNDASTDGKQDAETDKDISTESDSIDAGTDRKQDAETDRDINQKADNKDDTSTAYDKDNGDKEFDPDVKIEPDNKEDVNENQNPLDDTERIKLQDKIKEANAELLALRDALTKHDREAVSQPDYSAEELKYDEWQNTKLALEANVQNAKENYNDISYAREVTLRQKLRDIANAQVTTRADSTAAIYELDIKQTQAQLASLYSLQKQNGEIKALSDGVVSAIRIEVGARTSDTAAILMTDDQRPCQFKFSITKEQGKYVHLNDTVELKLNGQSAAMEITADYFTENAQGGYDIICMLPEGVGKPGLSGNIKKTVQGDLHDLTLPVDAVFGDTGAYYLYTLNEKEGILGSEYYVEKIKVQVKDRNDRYVALEPGTIGTDTKVITYSTKELKQGESVRPQFK